MKKILIISLLVTAGFFCKAQKFPWQTIYQNANGQSMRHTVMSGYDLIWSTNNLLRIDYDSTRFFGDLKVNSNSYLGNSRDDTIHYGLLTDSIMSTWNTTTGGYAWSAGAIPYSTPKFTYLSLTQGQVILESSNDNETNEYGTLTISSGIGIGTADLVGSTEASILAGRIAETSIALFEDSLRIVGNNLRSYAHNNYLGSLSTDFTDITGTATVTGDIIVTDSTKLNTLDVAGNARITGNTYLKSDTTGQLYGRVIPRWTSITSNATPAINTDKYDCYSITALATNITSFTTGLTGTPVNFQKLMIRIKDDGSARAITWGASFASGVVSLPVTTVAGKTLLVLFIYNSVAGTWMCTAAGSNM